MAIFHHDRPYYEAGAEVETTDHVSVLARLGQLMILIPGAILVVSGAITLAKTGIHSDMSQPVVSVMGHTHSPWLGVIELAVGVLLLGSGAAWWRREPAVVLGALLAVAGIIVLADPSNAPRELAVDSGYGWIPLILGVVAFVGGLLPAGISRTRRVYDRT